MQNGLLSVAVNLLIELVYYKSTYASEEGETDG